LVSELRLTAGCVLMDLASPAVSGTSVYANGLKLNMEMAGFPKMLMHHAAEDHNLECVPVHK